MDITTIPWIQSKELNNYDYANGHVSSVKNDDNESTTWVTVVSKNISFKSFITYTSLIF